MIAWQTRVIIPVFNCKEYLQQAVESIILQPYQSAHVILVDDWSTAGSFLLCNELANQDKKIQVLHQKNGGVSEARNTGLKYIFSTEESSNDYIALDADDNAWGYVVSSEPEPVKGKEDTVL